MKAIVCTRYGPPDVLELRDVARPSPGDGEVLIRVHAVSINSWDVEMLRGRPYVLRLMGLRRPPYSILGADVAGVVEAVGRKVTRYRPGDAVYGDLSRCGWGGLAEYVCADPAALEPVPSGLSFEQAAAVPQAAVMALQAVRQYGKVASGHAVLVNGAGGGVGTFAVQMAKSCGAEVTGVDRASKLESIRSLGADRVIDYAREDFTRSGTRYDVIIDVAVCRSMRARRRALKPDGTCVMVGGSLARIFGSFLLGRLLPGRRRMVILGHSANQDLALIGEMLEAGTVVPAIDRCYPLSETAEAFRDLGAGKALGKLVMTLEPG